MLVGESDAGGHARPTAARLIGRLERLPTARIHVLARVLVGSATFFDAFTSLAIAFALPEMIREWDLLPSDTGAIISAGYVGQLAGALFFGWLAERAGRLRTLGFCVAIYSVMNVACIFAGNYQSLVLFRFIQGVGIGGEVPVAGAYINEFAGARHRGRFFLLYEMLFSIGLLFCGIFGSVFVPLFGWRAMFIMGTVPILLIAPLRILLPESPRWLISKGRLAAADAVISAIEASIERHGTQLPPPIDSLSAVSTAVVGRWSELFSSFYRRRTFTLWALWFLAYLINNGMVTWMPSLYRSMFDLPLRTSLVYGFVPNVVGVFTSLTVALFIDTVGRRRWYIWAFSLAAILLLMLWFLGATSAVEVLIFTSCIYATVQTVTLSLYLYTGELYPTRIRAIGSGCGSACLRLGSAISPLIVGFIVSGYGINWVFLFFAAAALLGAGVTSFFAIETKGKVLEELSP
jgi:MFS transporter, putative metabolite:H+ symporter